MEFRGFVTRSCAAFILTYLLVSISPAQTSSVHGLRAPSPHQMEPEDAPLVPSPGDWQQLAKFVSGRGLATDFFGNSVGISGDTVVVSSETNYVNAIGGFVFLKSTQGWGNTPPVAGLKLPSPVDRILVFVAIDADTIAIGCPSYGPGYPSYVYVFVKPATGWANMTPTAVLTPSDTIDGYFGRSLSVSGNTIVVGDSGYNSSGGAVYVYVKPASGWTDMMETAKLTASDGILNDLLGNSVSISGTTIAAGAPQLDSGTTGKAYVFVEPAQGWTSTTQTAELTVPDALEVDIGSSISTNGSLVIAGAPSFSNGAPGAAYLFVKPPSGWTNMTETATLTPGDGQWDYAEFGGSVAVSGEFVVAGSSRRGAPPFTGEGGVYVFKEPPTGWQNLSGLTVLTGSDMRYYSLLGGSVSMSGNVLATGAYTFSSAGAAYVFGLP